ncbi:MAG TPA: helix-turn-helix transcriptional regulator [Steroidobacter sp.]|uniref:ArsR/SmtB family transcription factor n=1 Tax=Steroidobacter sp. TaxID=1978227 RepID=UPI002EDAC4FA
MQEHELDTVFQALASQVRRQIIDIVAAAPGCRVSEVVEHFDLSRIGVLKHINVLEQAGLLTSQKVGRDRPLYVNLAPLQVIHERWSDQYRSFWAGRLTRLKYAVERSNEE